MQMHNQHDLAQLQHVKGLIKIKTNLQATTIIRKQVNKHMEIMD